MTYRSAFETVWSTTRIPNSSQLRGTHRVECVHNCELNNMNGLSLNAFPLQGDMGRSEQYICYSMQGKEGVITKELDHIAEVAT